MLSTPLARLFPLGRVALVGAALVALSTLFIHFGHFGHRCHREAPAQGYLLTLSIEDEDPRCYYGSQWNQGGPVLLDHDGSDGMRVEFQRRFPFVDGCWWESTEVLVPTGKSEYAYSYSERIVSCAKDAIPGIACTRAGHVTLTPIDE